MTSRKRKSSPPPPPPPPPPPIGAVSLLSIGDCTCPICFEVFVEPVSTPCSHELCIGCLQILIKEPKFLCPLCREDLRPWIDRSHSLASLIDKDRWALIQKEFPDEIRAKLENKTALILTESIQKFKQYGIKDRNFESIVPHARRVNQSEDHSIRQEYLEMMKREEESRRWRQMEEERLSSEYILTLIGEEQSGQDNDVEIIETIMPARAAAVAFIRPPRDQDEIIEIEQAEPVVVPNEARCQIYVENMYAGVRQSQLRTYFSAYGEVTSVDLKEKNLMKHAFVTFANIEAVDSAMAARPHLFELSTLVLRRVEHLKQVPSPMTKTNTIRLDITPRGAGSNVISNYFMRFGRVKIVHRTSAIKYLIEFRDYDPVDRLMLFERDVKLDGDYVCHVSRERSNEDENSEQEVVRLVRSSIITRSKKRNV